MKEITQKSSSGNRTYSIKEDGLYIEIKTSENFTARLIKFEDIGFEEIITKYQPGPQVVSLFVSVLFNLLFILYFVLSFAERFNLGSGVTSGVTGGLIVCLSIWGKFAFKFEKQKILKGNVSLVFDYFKKNQRQVDEFIAELKTNQRDYMRNKYMEIDEYRPIENQKDNFYWLYESGYVNREEMQELMEKLERKVIVKGF